MTVRDESCTSPPVFFDDLFPSKALFALRVQGSSMVKTEINTGT